MKKIILGIISAAAVILIAYFLRGNEYSRTEYMLDTVITIKGDNKKAVDTAFDEIERLEKLLSAYRPESDVSKINTQGRAEVSFETAELIEKANEYKELTKGAFDISIKPVVDLWNIKGGGYVPTAVELDEKLRLLGDVKAEGREVTLEKDGMQIDLGGIAKGYVGDRVKKILLENGVKSAIADLGGNIVVVGGESKKIGLQNPAEPRGSVFAKVNVADKTVVTSGGYERNFEFEGKTYHHIIDPKTGKNPENNVLSVTIIADDGASADALSTACLILGKDEGLKLAEKAGVHAVIYTDDGIFYTKGLEGAIHIEKERLS